MTAVDGDLWIFGYGSLMWRPGFTFTASMPATLVGYRRCFCIYSVHHRGSAARPGLVLGLDRGGVCHGMAFRVPAQFARDTLAYLRQREQVNGVYREVSVKVAPQTGGPAVPAVAYLAERAHPSYAGVLPIAEQVHLIRAARGRSGTNLDYLFNTIAHLRLLGIADGELERVYNRVGVVFARGSAAEARPSCKALTQQMMRGPVRARRLRPGDRRRFIHRLQLAGLR